MYKFIGIILVLISCGAFIMRKADAIKQRTKNLKELKKAVTYLKDELEFSTPEISVLCKKMADATNGEISFLFERSAQFLEQDEKSDFNSAMLSAIKDKDLFSDVGKSILLEFSQNLGKKNLEIEIKNLEKSEKDLERLVLEEEEKTKNDTKLMYTLGLSLAAVFVIMII